MKKSLLFAFASILLASTVVKAQFTVDAQLRPRAEYNHGYKKMASAGQDGVLGISQRTRLNFGYGSKWIDLYVSVQDVRMWGATAQLASADGITTTLHQAYGVAKLAPWMHLKLGRQEIILDDHRMFGSVGWAQQARSHDAAILKFMPDDKTKIDFGVAYNPTKTVSTPGGNYRTFQYLWLNRSFGNVKASVLFLNNGKQVTASDSVDYMSATDTTRLFFDQSAIYYTQTVGFRAGYKGKKFQAFGTFYYQMGNNGGYSAAANDSIDNVTITKRNTAAMLARLDLSGKLGPIILSGGYEYQSGNSQINASADDQAFSPFYGTNHKFNGHMDYFYVGNHFGKVGLQDIFLGVKYKKNKFWVGATGHYFMAANDVWDTELYATEQADAVLAGTDPTLVEKKAMSSGLGIEIDFSMGYNVSKELGFAFGYSQMLGTSTLGAVSGGDYKESSNWAYLMVTFKPKLFNSANYQLKKKEAAEKKG